MGGVCRVAGAPSSEDSDVACLPVSIRGPRAQISRLAGPLSAAGSVVQKRGGAERSPRELAQVAPAASCGPLSGGLGSSLVAPGSGPGFPTRA